MVRPVHVAAGAVAVACFIAGPALIALEWRSGDDGLVVELEAEPPLTLSKEASIVGRLRGHRQVTLSVDDGEPQSVEARQVEVSADGAAPGLHVARLETQSDSSTRGDRPLWARTVALGFLQGPFEEPAAWHVGAARLHIGQAFLTDFADRVLSQKLPVLLASQPNAPPVQVAKVQLTWAGDGVDCKGHVDFANGKDLDLSGHVRLSIDDQHALHLERAGEVTVTGSQLDVWREDGRKEGARQGALIGAKRGGLWGLLGGPVGGLIGAGVGAVVGKDKGEKAGATIADERVKGRVTAAVDKNGIAGIEELLRLPPSFEVKEGIHVRLRYCQNLQVETGQRVSIGFDAQALLAAKSTAATPGPVQRHSVEPPFARGPLPAIVLDVSSDLLDGFLDTWWRSGTLTTLMNEPRWLDAVNSGANGDRLNFKLQQVEPLLPPSLEIVAGAAVLRTAETKLTLVGKGDAKARDARLFVDVQVVPRYVPAKQQLELDWQVAELVGTCHDPDPTTGHVLLRPCFTDLLQIVKDRSLAVPNPGVARTLALPLHHLLFKGAEKGGLPFALSKLSHITPTILDSHGAAWVRITADVSL